ncbi:Ulp1 protease family, carboxy-terminal domain protein [Sesbania bispinosa]|nr:Ulp1 protease family, carboxy-terminal domain protein [Sesbania bispinosa]
MAGSAKAKGKCTPQKDRKESPIMRRRSLGSCKKPKLEEVIEISSSNPMSEHKVDTTVGKVSFASNFGCNQDQDGELRRDLSEVNTRFDGITKFMINLCEVIAKTNPGFTVKKMHNGVPILLTDWPTPPSSFVSKKSDTNSLMEKLKYPKEGQTTSDPSIPIGKVQLNDQKQLGNNIFSQRQDDGHQTYYINYNPYNSWNPDGRKTGIEIPHWMEVTYRQPVNMILNELEAAVVAYIFQPIPPNTKLGADMS